METLSGHVMNLANSIIGVSVLAMPYCFKQCGILLSIILLLLSSVVSRLTCHYLLKSAIISRRKTFEFLAFHLFGGVGKLSIEIGMIGFLLGTSIAYFVVMGDLGPEIVSEVTKAHITNTMRTSILMALALFIVLPLGLLRNVHSLNGVSKATMMFYCCLVLRVIIEAIPSLFEDDWYHKVNFWRVEGLLQCIPIFSMALFCQTQLFEIYDVVPNPTLDKMNSVIRYAVNLCTGVYICVGMFGYIAFVNKPFTGNILLSFEPGFISHIMKVGFIFSVAFSFPLVIFPCRASLYSCLYKEGYSIHEGSLNYIPEGKFKGLTMLIVLISLVIGILIPNIELVLGLVGSTIGVMICVLFPVTCFICISQRNTNERLLAQFLLMIGVFVMVVGTYKNLQTVDQVEPILTTSKAINPVDPNLLNIETSIKKLPITEKLETKEITNDENVKEVRREPPQPVEPVEDDSKKDQQNELQEKIKKALPSDKKEPVLVPKIVEPVLPEDNLINDTKNDQVDIEAIKKQDNEELLEKTELLKENENIDEHKVLIESIQKQNEVQKEIVEQQKQLLEVIKKQQKVEEVKQEKMKAVKEIESIALKAIEKISEGEDTKKVVDDMKKGIEKSELKEKEAEKLIKQKEDVRGDELKETESVKDSHKESIEKYFENEKLDEKIANNIKDEKKFEENVRNVKMEVQELSSQLNEVDKKLKNKDQPLHQSVVENEKNQENLLNVQKRHYIQNEVNIQNIIEPKVVPKSQEIVKKARNSQILANNSSLYLKMGKNELKISDEQNPSQLLPLPIVMSKNLVKDSDNKPLNNLELNKNEDNIEKQLNNEVQAMRRDILSIPVK